MAGSRSKDILARLRELSTCDVADTLGALGIKGHMPSLKQIVPQYRVEQKSGEQRMVGYAHTARFLSSNVDLKKAPEHHVDTAFEDSVVCLSVPWPITTANWGDLMTSRAKHQKAVGAITNGLVRDVDAISEMGFNLFSRGTSVHGNKGVATLVAVAEPIELDGITIRERDIIHGDVNGVVRIPGDQIDEFLQKATELREIDKACSVALSSGWTVKDTFAMFRKKPKSEWPEDIKAKLGDA